MSIVQLFRVHLDHDPMEPRELRRVPGHRGGEPDVVQDPRMQAAPQAANVHKGLGGGLAEPLRQLHGLRDRFGPFDGS